MRLARKLLLASVVTMLVVFATRAAIRVRQMVHATEADTREHLRIISRAVRAPIAEVWRLEGGEQALRLVQAADRSIRRRDIRWVSLAEDAPERDRPRAPRAVLGGLAEGGEVEWTNDADPTPRLYYYVPLGTNGEPPGAIETSESLAAARETLRKNLVDVLLTSAIAVAAAITVLSLLGVSMVGRPMRRLVEKARRIGAGDLGGPLRLAQRDEIGELAAEMNQMCDRLAAAQRRVDREAAERLAAVDQLRHADRLSTIGKLASGIAHELGTPLNVVSGRARMIATGEVAGADAADSARVIAEQAARMTNIIRQLLDFARRRGPTKAPCDLLDLCRSTMAMLTPLAQKSRVTFTLDPPAEAVRVSVDAAQIQQVITNLVVNGMQAMPGGGIITVSISDEQHTPPADQGGRPGRYACVHVRDEGSGIRPELVAHVFEPFFTTKSVGEGTGLGLSVAYGIVADHGGWITIDTNAGAGSRFSIHLPCEELET